MGAPPGIEELLPCSHLGEEDIIIFLGLFLLGFLLALVKLLVAAFGVVGLVYHCPAVFSLLIEVAGVLVLVG
jgi:hypothetical protein